MTFAAEPHTVGPARRFAVSALLAFSRDAADAADAAGAMTGEALTDLADDLRIAASELATNAALHARTDYTVTVSLDGQVVRLSVSDGSAGRPRRPRHNDQDSTTGRGLQMVAQLATAWGVDQGRDGAVFGGKTVWCEFDTLDRVTRDGDASAENRPYDASAATRRAAPASRDTAMAATLSRAAA